MYMVLDIKSFGIVIIHIYYIIHKKVLCQKREIYQIYNTYSQYSSVFILHICAEWARIEK